MAEEQNSAAKTEAAAEAPKQQFAVQRIYLKDLSFEAPQGAGAFSKQWQPKVDQELNIKTNKIKDDLYEVVLMMTVTVKLEDETVFLIEVHQAGVFTAEGIEGQNLAQVLNTVCPNILFPYAREAIDNVVIKGSFPALMLPPVNFDALFAQAVARAQQEQQGAAASETVN